MQKHVTGLVKAKGLKTLDAPIPLSCHFSVKTHHKGAAEIGILIYLLD